MTDWKFEDVASAADETHRGAMNNLLELREWKAERTPGGILVYQWIDRICGEIGGLEIHNTNGNAEIRWKTPPFVRPDMSRPDWQQVKQEQEEKRREAHAETRRYFVAWLNHALVRKMTIVLTRFMFDGTLQQLAELIEEFRLSEDGRRIYSRPLVGANSALITILSPQMEYYVGVPNVDYIPKRGEREYRVPVPIVLGKIHAQTVEGKGVLIAVECDKDKQSEFETYWNPVYQEMRLRRFVTDSAPVKNSIKENKTGATERKRERDCNKATWGAVKAACDYLLAGNEKTLKDLQRIGKSPDPRTFKKWAHKVIQIEYDHSTQTKLETILRNIGEGSILAQAK